MRSPAGHDGGAGRSTLVDLSQVNEEKLHDRYTGGSYPIHSMGLPYMPIN